MAMVRLFVGAAVAVLLISAPALAATDDQVASVNPQPASAPSASTAGLAAAQTVLVADPGGQSAPVAAGADPAAAPTTDPAAAPVMAPPASPGPVDVVEVANAPIPDTAANRKKYGRPLSHAGRATDPAGN